MMSFCSIVSLAILIILELNFSFRICFRRLFNRNKSDFKKAAFFIEDSDVLVERNRIDNLVKEKGELGLINKSDSLIVHYIQKRYPNNHLAVNKLR